MPLDINTSMLLPFLVYKDKDTIELHRSLNLLLYKDNLETDITANSSEELYRKLSEIKQKLQSLINDTHFSECYIEIDTNLGHLRHILYYILNRKNGTTQTDVVMMENKIKNIGQYISDARKINYRLQKFYWRLFYIVSYYKIQILFILMMLL